MSQANRNEEDRVMRHVRWFLFAVVVGVVALAAWLAKRLPALVACAMLSALGATYYVDPATGSDSNNGTSQGTAWAHVPGAVGFSGSGWSTIGSGDTVVVKGGSTNNYQIKFAYSNYTGSAAFDTFTVISGHVHTVQWGTTRAIIDGQNTRLYGVAIDAVSGGTLDGFEIREIKDGANAIYGNGSACVEVGATTGRPTHWKIRRCYLHRAYGTTADRGFGIAFYGPDASFASCTSIIELNVIENIRTKCIEAYGTNHIVRANFIQKWGDHGVVFTCDYSDFYNNVMNATYTDNGISEVNGAFVHDESYTFKVNNTHNDVWNNVIFNASGADNHAQGFGSHGAFNRFFHNSGGFFKHTGNFGDNGANVVNIGFERNVANNQSDNQVKNNIGAFCVPSTGNGQFFFYDHSTNMAAFYNDWYSGAGSQIATWYDGSTHQLTVAQLNAGGFGNGITTDNNQASDPLWQGGSFPSGINTDGTPNTDYFKLTASTPNAIRNTGNVLSGLPQGGSQASTKFATDILGATRSLWAMGAYESGSTNTPPVLGAPQNLRILTAF